MPPRCLALPALDTRFLNPRAEIPYGLTTAEIKLAMEDIYGIVNAINTILYSKVEQRLEDLVLGNSLSGIISELVVKSIADRSESLLRNEKVGGHPDLLPVGYYDSCSILHGDEGIEVKSSIQPGGWQGHNPEACWIMVFRYSVDTQTEPIEEREPIRFVQVLTAQLSQEDWSFSGRRGQSRRTPTASITESGMHKLRSNPIYQEPGAVVWPERYSYEALYGNRRLI
jgi:hypothetical protein